jgi:hypothetical protein
LPGLGDHIVDRSLIDSSTKDPNAHAVTVVLEYPLLPIRNPSEYQLIETSSSQDSEK